MNFKFKKKVKKIKGESKGIDMKEVKSQKYFISKNLKERV